MQPMKKEREREVCCVFWWQHAQPTTCKERKNGHKMRRDEREQASKRDSNPITREEEEKKWQSKEGGKGISKFGMSKKKDLSAFVASVVVGRVPEKGSAGKFGMHLQLAHEKNAMCAL